MSNTRFSRLSSRGSTRRPNVRELVSQRVGREWCLFLVRDGVINRQVIGDYVRTPRDFVWLPGARHAMAKLRKWAPHLVVVTNQQGIGKGLMTADDLAAIHQGIRRELAGDGVAVDAFKVCPHLESAACACRKPRPGLIVDWLEQNPEAEPSLSMMVGDSRSDLELARNVAAITGGCASIQVGGLGEVNELADASFDSLWDFAVAVGHAQGEQV
jgi:histidinol-phosphate phosphatase family protein